MRLLSSVSEVLILAIVAQCQIISCNILSELGESAATSSHVSPPSVSSSSSSSATVVAKEYNDRRPPERSKFTALNPRYPYGRSRTHDVTEAVDREEAQIRLPRPVNSGFGPAPNANTSKVFGVGLSRTGTSSLATALQRLGLKCIHFDPDFTPFLPSGRRKFDASLSDLQPRLPTFEPQDDYNYQGIYDDVDCVLDLPTAFYYSEMLAVYPQALFISTEREVGSWYDSFSTYLNTIEHNIFAGGNLPITTRLMHKHVYGSELPNRALWTESFVKHYQRVQAVIPAEKLITLHIRNFQLLPNYNPFPEICKHLGLVGDNQCSKEKYPRANSHKQLREKTAPIREHALRKYQPIESASPSSTPFAYATLLADVNENSFKKQFLNAVMVFCHTVHRSYDDVIYDPSASAAATRYVRSEERSYDMIVFVRGRLQQDQKNLLYTCFDRILPIRNFGHAPRNLTDSRYYSIIRAKFWAWSLTEYKRVTFLDADQMVVRNLDALFFRDFYAEEGRSAYENTNVINEMDPQFDRKSTVLPLYTVLSTHAPICSSMFNLEPSLQAVIDLNGIFREGRWDADQGWNEYGAFDFQPDTVTLPLWPADSPWKHKKKDTSFPYLPLFPVPQFGNTAWTNSQWSFYCSWSDQGMLFYYFFLLRPIGGIVDSADIDHSIIHFIGVHKPWVFNNKVAINDIHGDKWKPVVAMWKRFAKEMNLPMMREQSESKSVATLSLPSASTDSDVSVKEIFASFHAAVGKLARPTSRGFHTACYGYGVGCGCTITTDPNGGLGTCLSAISDGTTCDINCNGGTIKSGASTHCSNGVLTTSQSCIPQSCTLPGTPTGVTAGGCTAGGTLNSGNSCTYTAIGGWSLSSGSLTVTCTAASLSTGPTMSPNPCGAPSLNTGFSQGGCSAGVSSGNSCTLSLDGGYFLSGGSLTMTCSAGSYTAAVPTATGNPCSAPGLSTGLTIGGCSGSTSSGSSCNLALASGYSLSSGSLTLSCSLGAFTPLPNVSPDPCAAPTPPTGTSIGDCGSGVTSGSTCTLVKLTGYSIATGSLTLSCSAAVLDPLPTLTEDPCTLPALPNGVTVNTCSPASILSQNSCSYSQITGWSLLSGSYTITCVRGVLSTGPTMGGDSCPAPTLPTGLSLGSCTGSTPDSSSSTLTLDFGYSIATGGLTLSCSLGQFNPLPTVTPNPCAAPTAPTGTAIGNCGSGITSGGFCTLVKLAGYSVATGSLTLNCMAQVLDPLPTLTEDPCTAPTAPTGTTIGNCGSGVASGGSCTLIQLAGYSISAGSLTLNCVGTVLDTLPILTEDPCSSPILPAGLLLNTCAGTTLSGTSCDLKVDSLYTLSSGSLSLSCFAGTLSSLPTVTQQSGGSTGAANPIICTLPPLPAGVDAGSCNMTSIPSQSSCTYSGKIGWTLASNSLTVSCSLGTLSAWPVMSPNPCQSPVIGDGIRIGSCAGPTNSGSSCTLTLYEGYVLSSGSLFMSCALGNFIQAVPTATLKLIDVSTADPCAGSTLCKNGGTCVAQLVASQNSSSTIAGYSLFCKCLTSPVLFMGANCEFAIVGCPNCISTSRGNSSIVLYGVGFENVVGIQIAGVNVEIGTPRTIDEVSNDITVVSALATLRSLSTDFLVVRSLHQFQLTSPALTYAFVNSTVPPTSSRVSYRQLASPSSSAASSSAVVKNPASSYQMLSVSVRLQTALTFNFSSLVFYSSSDCIKENEFTPDGQGGCNPCPDGATCPGGGRAWPQPGYWSYSEYTAPIKCKLQDTCSGVDAAVARTSSTGVGAYFQGDQKCAVGYTGTGCLQCETQYYQLNGRCAFCGSTTDQSSALSLTFISAFGVLFLLALSVAFLNSVPLALFVAAFVVLQEVALVGLEAAPSLPQYADQVTSLFVYLNLINFEIEILRPGCGGIPSFTYVTKFCYTLLFMALAVVVFALACLIRLLFKRRELDATSVKEKYEQNPSKPTKLETPRVSPNVAWIDFKLRFQHSLLILFSIFYLRLCILQLKGFKCGMAPDPMQSLSSDAVITESLYLTEDLQTMCYTGAHLATIIGVIILFLVYTIGFPTFCFVLLMRAFAHADSGGLIGLLYRRFSFLRGEESKSQNHTTGNRNTDGKDAPSELEHEEMKHKEATLRRYREDGYGFLFLGFRAEHFAACLELFFIHMSFALVTVFASDGAILKLFLFGVISAVTTISVSIQLPYEKHLDNIRKVVLGIATVVHTALLLAVQVDGFKSGYLYGLVALFALIVCTLLFRRQMPCLNRTKVASIKSPDKSMVAEVPDTKSAPPLAIGVKDDEPADHADVISPAARTVSLQPFNSPTSPSNHASVMRWASLKSFPQSSGHSSEKGSIDASVADLYGAPLPSERPETVVIHSKSNDNPTADNIAADSTLPDPSSPLPMPPMTISQRAHLSASQRVRYAVLLQAARASSPSAVTRRWLPLRLAPVPVSAETSESPPVPFAARLTETNSDRAST